MIVKVYTAPNCYPCTLTKRALSLRGVVFDEIPAKGNEALLKELGATSLPFVIAGDRSWSGFIPDLLKTINTDE